VGLSVATDDRPALAAGRLLDADGRGVYPLDLARAAETLSVPPSATMAWLWEPLLPRLSG
jgi:hypothetical protein